MPEIRSISYSNSRFALVEDPNPAYNRLFFDGQAIDLNTLTPTWQKQFAFSVAGQAQYAGFNGANGTFWDDIYLNNNSGTKYGPLKAMTRGNQSSYGYTDVYPVSDNSWHRLGYIQLQKGTISTYATHDNQGPYTDTTSSSPATTLYGAWDTYWHTLDFTNYPITKSWKSPLTGYCHFLHPSDGVTVTENSTQYASTLRKSWGWFVYNSDITTGVNNSANNNAIFANWHYLTPTHFCWEDTNIGIMYGIRCASPTANYITATRNYNAGNTINYYTTISLSQYKPFFMGVDNFNCPYWLAVNIAATDNGYYIYKMDPRTESQTTVISNLSRGNYLSGHRAYPSNIRRANSNTYVFYTGHWLSSGPAPIRMSFDVNTGNVAVANCNVAYPGTSGFTNYASPIGNNGSNPYGYDGGGSYSESWMIKPHQFINNGNTYITYWLVDQTAYPSGTLSGTLALSYTTNGQIRWGTTLQRTMLTYQINPTNGVSAAANDSYLTYHSAYTFSSLADIPKNFMPINANNTLMAVVSYGKTSFLAWNNNSGWSSSGTYNQEFRMMGMDSTNRIWGYAMDKMNGSIHVITPSLSVNVAVTMAASNYTYSGTTINTSATINAYDYTGSRIAANVSLTIDGTTMTFADNGLKTLNVLTSASGDTTVNLNIYGGGVNNIYAYA